MSKNATLIRLKIGLKTLVGETNVSIDNSSDVINVSSKPDGRTRRILPGRVARTVNFEAMADDTNTTDYGYKDAHAAMKAGTIIEWSIIRGAVTIDEGVGYISSLSKDNTDNAASTFSGSIRVTLES